MNWNYRVIRKKYHEASIEHYYEIHEVHYDEKGNIRAWTETPIWPMADSLKDLKKSLKMMLKDCNKPILEIKTDKKGNQKLVEVKE
jgi:hypothetical protein